MTRDRTLLRFEPFGICEGSENAARTCRGSLGPLEIIVLDWDNRHLLDLPEHVLDTSDWVSTNSTAWRTEFSEETFLVLHDNPNASRRGDNFGKPF